MAWKAAVNLYALWTILHITAGHGHTVWWAAVNLYSLWTVLGITAGHGDMVWVLR